MQTTRTDKISC